MEREERFERQSHATVDANDESVTETQSRSPIFIDHEVFRSVHYAHGGSFQQVAEELKLHTALVSLLAQPGERAVESDVGEKLAQFYGLESADAFNPSEKQLDKEGNTSEGKRIPVWGIWKHKAPALMTETPLRREKTFTKLRSLFTRK